MLLCVLWALTNVLPFLAVCFIFFIIPSCWLLFFMFFVNFRLFIFSIWLQKLFVYFISKPLLFYFLFYVSVSSPLQPFVVASAAFYPHSFGCSPLFLRPFFVARISALNSITAFAKSNFLSTIIFGETTPGWPTPFYGACTLRHFALKINKLGWMGNSIRRTWMVRHLALLPLLALFRFRSRCFIFFLATRYLEFSGFLIRLQLSFLLLCVPLLPDA